MGDPDRDAFANRLGISKGALANYERGDRIPDSTVLAAYRKTLGVNISWLVTGEGSMFDEPAKAPPQTINPDVLEKLARLVTLIYREAGIKLPGEQSTVEAGILYNDLIARVSDLSDMDEVEATLPQLRHQLKKRLAEAVAEPGTGKREAS